jgi:hypothetical protein
MIHQRSRKQNASVSVEPVSPTARSRRGRAYKGSFWLQVFAAMMTFVVVGYFLSDASSTVLNLWLAGKRSHGSLLNVPTSKNKNNAAANTRQEKRSVEESNRDKSKSVDKKKSNAQKVKAAVKQVPAAANKVEKLRKVEARNKAVPPQEAVVTDANHITVGWPRNGAPRRTTTDTGIDVSDPKLYESIDLNGDSSTATVMGMASGYDLPTYESFVGTLRKSGFKGNIILGVHDPSPQVLDYFEYRNVTAKLLQWTNCTYMADSNNKEVATCADPYPDIKVRSKGH